jgi:hypothetical protein
MRELYVTYFQERMSHDFANVSPATTYSLSLIGREIQPVTNVTLAGDGPPCRTASRAHQSDLVKKRRAISRLSALAIDLVTWAAARRGRPMAHSHRAVKARL